MCSLFIFSCSAPSEDASGTIGVLIAQRDSLRTVQKQIRSELDALDKKITSLDTASANALPVVEATHIQLAPFSKYLTIHGNVESSKNALINVEVPGKITAVHVKTGQRVSAGQVLVSQDTDILRKNIKELESSLELATTMFQKQSSLWQEGVGTEVQFLQAKNQKESLELKLATTKSQMAKSEIRAPFSGIVDEVFVKKGEVANGMAPVIRLVNTQSLHVKCDVSEQHLDAVDIGTPVRIHFPNLNSTATGNVNRIGRFINPNNRTFKIEVDLPEMDKLMPNLLVNLDVLTLQVDSAISIAEDLVQQDAQGNQFVFTLQGSGEVQSVVKNIIEEGDSYDGQVWVKSGLQLRDKLITVGGRSVKAMQEVKVQLKQ